jgi:hypothetical protein
MPVHTLPQLAACRMRITNLDADGSPTVGSGNLYVTDAMVSVAFSHVYEDGDEIAEKNACGAVALNYKGDDSLKWGTITIQLAAPDPYLQAILSNGSVLTDPPLVGFASPDIGTLSTAGISIEVWTKRILNGVLDPDAPYAWWVYPLVRNLRPGDHTHENAGLKPTYSGQAFENANWGDGPINDFPVASTQMYQWIEATTLPALSAGVYGTVLADA